MPVIGLLAESMIEKKVLQENKPALQKRKLAGFLALFFY